MLNQRPWGSTLLGAGFFYCILSAISLVSKLHQGSRGLPRPGVAFPTTFCLTPTGTRTLLPWLLSWLSYIIVQRPLDRPLDLLNRMFNRHQTEITVTQFRGHFLLVRQSMRVSWDFLACPILLANFRPRDFLSWLLLECVTSFRCITLNGILGRVEGQNITLAYLSF